MDETLCKDSTINKPKDGFGFWKHGLLAAVQDMLITIDPWTDVSKYKLNAQGDPAICSGKLSECLLFLIKQHLPCPLLRPKWWDFHVKLAGNVSCHGFTLFTGKVARCFTKELVANGEN